MPTPMENVLSYQHIDVLQKIILERVKFCPPLKAEAAMHNEACFLYAVNGTSKAYGPNENIDLFPEEGLVMKCGHYLNSWKPVEGRDSCEAVAVHFYPEVLQLIYDHEYPDFLKTHSTPAPSNIEKVKVNAMLKQYMDNLIFYLDNPEMLTEDLVKVKVKELILLLVTTDDSGKIKTILQDLFNPTELDFKAIIKRHLFEDLSIEDLALLTHLSVSTFKRKFKEVFEESPAKYIKKKRLEKAADLLKFSNERITHICYDCGFSEVGHFSKSFTSEYGISPTEYREQHLNQFTK